MFMFEEETEDTLDTLDEFPVLEPFEPFTLTGDPNNGLLPFLYKDAEINSRINRESALSASAKESETWAKVQAYKDARRLHDHWKRCNWIGPGDSPDGDCPTEP